MLTSGKYNRHHKVCLFTQVLIAISCLFIRVLLLIKSAYRSTYYQQLIKVVNKCDKNIVSRFPNDVFFACPNLKMCFCDSEVNL